MWRLVRHPESPQFDADRAIVNSAWPTLPDELRRVIVAMVAAGDWFAR
jgi:hypothetical protein